VSGFHHAQYKHAAGFCTFNGLVVTALDIVRRGGRVGILDCDQHYGDGTDALLDRLLEQGQLKPFDVLHWTQGELYSRSAYSMQIEESYWDALTREAQKMFTMCDVVLYQAGADPHKDDPYGGWMTDLDLRMRDAIVFATCARLRGRCVWNLAGGYQRDTDGGITPVLNIHAATMDECLRAWRLESAFV
jgi:acetoin utilization deacetylase AcuC-like enzyme